MTFCFHLSFSLSLFTSTFPFLKVWLTAASWRRVHFRFLWLWLPQLGDMTDGRDRGNGPLSIHLPSSSNFGPGGKRQILVSQSNFAKYTLQNLKYSKNILFMADIHLSHATPAFLKHLLQRWNGPIFWQSDPKMHWFGTTQYIILKNFIWSRFLLRRRPDVFHIFVGSSLQMIFTFPPSTTWFLVFLDCSAVRGVQRKNILNTAKQDRKRPKNFYKAFFDVKKESARKSLVSRNCRTIWIELSFSHL